jgi:hypothetical protein
MVNYNFWQDWKKKNKVEQKAIKSVKKARDLVINSVPKNKLVAIYIKGSFTRREMKKGSDVDMVPIVAENKYEGKVFAVNGPEVDPVMVVPLSLWEFKHNKLFTKSHRSYELRAKPDRLLRKLNECKLIYGKPLDPKKFPIRSDKKALKDEIKTIKKGYILHYENREIDFAPLLKEVFWLVELEQNVKGEKVIHSFKGISKSVKDKKHIVHDAYGLREKHSKIKEKRFISKLKIYLAELDGLFKNRQ